MLYIYFYWMEESKSIWLNKKNDGACFEQFFNVVTYIMWMGVILILTHPNICVSFDVLILTLNVPYWEIC